MSVLHTDDNLIEARLRQLEARTSITGNLQPPSADAFWPEMPLPQGVSTTAPASPNRWLGPVLGIVVGSVVTQMITALGSSDVHPPAAQVAASEPAPAAATSAAVDPTTQALSRLIAAKPATVTPSLPAVRSIDPTEIIKLQQTRKLTLGRQDPFAVLAPDVTPAQPPVAALPPVQVIMPDPPMAPMATPAPKPKSQVRFNGSFAVDGTYTALVEETAQGQSTMRRLRQGDTVLGGYRVVEIGLRTLKLRWGGETVMLSVGTSQDLDHRAGHSGLSAIAPESPDLANRARPAVWRPSPATSTQAPLSTPMATPLPPSISEPPPAPDPVAPSPADVVPEAVGADESAAETNPTALLR
jgi:hypothetical protein